MLLAFTMRPLMDMVRLPDFILFLLKRCISRSKRDIKEVINKNKNNKNKNKNIKI